MQLRHLKTFAAVASTLNFTRAAEQVHLSQSSVTEQIQALETDLGAALFDRSGRKPRLTPAGQRLLGYADDLLALADEARAEVADAAGLSAGQLAIGGLETLCATRLAPLIAEFARAHAAIRLRLQAAGSGELRNALRSGDMDVCFTFGAIAPETGLCAEILAQEALAIIAPPGHRLAALDAVTAGDLAGEAFLVTETGCVYRRMFDAAFPPEAPRRPRVAGEFNSIETIRRLVETGLGCAIVPASVAAGANRRLVARPWAGEARSVPIAMHWRRRRVLAPALRLFLDAARARFGALTPADGLHPHAIPSL